MRSNTLAAALASGTVAVACANAPPAPPPREAPSASAAPTAATADAGSESVPDAGVTTQRAPGGIVLLCDERCGSYFLVHLRLRGKLAALRASTVAACRNGSCTSIGLKPLHEPHWGSRLTLVRNAEGPTANVTQDLSQQGGGAGDRPIPVMAWSSWVPSLVVAIPDVEQMSENGCEPGCDADVAWVEFRDARDGDRYEVTLSRPGHAAGKNALRQTVQYTYEEVCSEKCARYETDARDPPWVVE